MEMTATRNWSHNSFERAMKYFTPLITADWMTYLKISPIEYSEWSDTIYVCVEFDITRDAEREIEKMDWRDQDYLKEKICRYITDYIGVFLNTKVGIKELRRPANYVPSLAS